MEELWARWVAGRRGHGLEVSPSGLLDEAVANGDTVAGGGGIDGGGGERKHVFEGSVRGGFEGVCVQVEE